VVPLREKAGHWILNTIIIFLYILDKFEDIGLDRLLSHPLENFFGFLRRSIHDVNTFRQMLMATAKSTSVTEAQKKLRLADRIPKRANNSGVMSYKSAERTSRSEQKVIRVTLPETVTDPFAMASILLDHCVFDELLIRSTFSRESHRFRHIWTTLRLSTQ
jgi:hypothetical protein